MMSIYAKCICLAILQTCVLLCLSVTAKECPDVRLSLGRIKGSLMTTRLNKTIYAYRGIRYGKSTEGKRRFQLPEPVDSWNDVFDASKEGPSCPLTAVPKLASEDCLRLNVYTTKLPDAKNKVKRPVIVFLHPGGFYGYSGQSYVFGPQYLADKDVVLVTLNYRLHIFGFIATGDPSLGIGTLGNLGLKDQVLALKFIKQHISAFGGDPDLITLTGYSSGAWSTSLHLQSNMSKDLFHRAVVMSGAAGTGQMYLPTEQRHLITKHASLVGCPADVNKLNESIECLKKVPHQLLSNATLKFAEWYDDPLLIWSPVQEPIVPGVEPFISAQPRDLIRQKKFHQMPIMTGVTRDEWIGITPKALEQAMRGDDTIFRNYTDNWEYAAPIIFGYQDNKDKNYISRELKKFYFNDEPITLKNGRNLGSLYAEGITFSNQRFAKLMAQYSQAPVYNYQFAYESRHSFYIWNVTHKPYGVVHHDDLQYLFYMSFIFPLAKDNNPEVPMIEKMTEVWYNFAKNGVPIPKDNKLFSGITWDNLNSKEHYENYLEIGKEWKMKRYMYPDRYALYDRLFPMKPLKENCK